MNICEIEQKARSSIYCEKLAVMEMTELTPADCSKQMRGSCREGTVADGTTQGAWTDKC